MGIEKLKSCSPCEGRQNNKDEDSDQLKESLNEAVKEMQKRLNLMQEQMKPKF